MAIIFAPVTTISVVRGTLWADDVQLIDKTTGNPVDLTGITELTSRIRRTINGPTLLELTLANTRLVIVNPATGLIGFRVSSADTLLLPQNGNRKAKYIYDAVIQRSALEYEAGAKGSLVVLPQITRPTESA